MKYLVAWAWEMDGHAGAAAMVCDSRQAVKDYIDQCLKDDDGTVEIFLLLLLSSKITVPWLTKRSLQEQDS